MSPHCPGKERACHEIHFPVLFLFRPRFRAICRSVSRMIDSRKRTDWLLVVAAFGAGVIGAAHIGKVPAALPELRAELDLGLVGAGWVVSIFSATGMACGVVAGLVSDRLGHCRVLLAALAILAVASFWGAHAGSGAELLFSRFAEGLAFLVIVVAAPSIIAESSSAGDRRLAVGMWGSFMPAGMALMLALAPFVQGWIGWRGSWMLMSAVTGLWIAMVLMALGRTSDPAHRNPSPGSMPPETMGQNLRQTILAPGPWLLAGCFSFYTLAWMALMVWLPSFAVEQRGLSLATAAMLTMLAVAVNFPGNLLGGWLLHRGLGSGGVAGLGALATLLAGPLIFLDLLPDPARYLACLLFSFSAALVPAAVLGGAPWFAPGPRQIAATNGLIVQGSHTGQLIGPPLIAALVGWGGGWQAGAMLFLACGAGITVFSMAIRRHERSRPGLASSPASSPPKRPR